MLKCRFIRTYNELKALSPAWDDLVNRSDFPDVFATSGFARAWWQAYGETRHMHVAVVEDESGRPRLIAPFQARKAHPYMWELIGRPRGDYNNLITAANDKEALRSLFDWLRSQAGWRMLVLRRVPGQASVLDFFERPYDGTLNRMEKLRRWLSFGSWLVYHETGYEHPLINGASLQGQKDLLESREFRRKVRWFQKQGDFAYLRVTDPDTIKQYLPQLFELHVKEWSKRPKGSFLARQTDRNFYCYIVDELAQYNALRLDMLKLNDSIVSFNLGFTWDKRLDYWLVCKDADYANGSPGRLLIGYIIKSALEAGLQEVDLLFGTETYKSEFLSEMRKTGALTIYRSPLYALGFKVRLKIDKTAPRPV